MKYTVHIDKALENAKLPQSTIAVFPIDELNYQPPSGCFGPSLSPGDQVKYQSVWNEKLHKSLADKFPNQKLVFLNKNEGPLAPGGVDFYSITEMSKRSTVAMLINAMKPDSIIFENQVVSPEMKGYLKKLTEATGAQYAVIFVTPSLSGETNYSTTWSSSPFGGNSAYSFGGFTPPAPPSPPNMMHPTTTSQTYYTADVKTLVWECATGKLLFSSGGWSKNSSSCFFVPAEETAINGANSKFEDNLDKIISRLIEYNASIRFADGAK